MRTREIEIRFPDGKSLSGRTAKQVLSIWLSKQWHFATEEDWRDELAKRAYIWSESYVDPKATPLEFLRQLEDAGLIKIESRKEEQ